MAQDKVFAAGMRLHHPKEKAPAWVKADIEIAVSEFIAFLQAYERNDKVRLQVKESERTGKLYAELNTFIPNNEQPAEPVRPNAPRPAAPKPTAPPLPQEQDELALDGAEEDIDQIPF